MNRYFIGTIVGNDWETIYSVTVGEPEDQRENNIATHKVVKLPVGDEMAHACLIGCVEYTYEDILVELQDSSWI